MLTEWFTRNRIDHEARQLYYSEFPHKYIWDPGKKEWIPRSKGFSLGRLTYVHPASGELYFLRLLLNHVRGALTFDYLKNVSGVVHPTFQLACKTLGLLGDDKEWEDVFCEAMATAHLKLGISLSVLFFSVMLLIQKFCSINSGVQCMMILSPVSNPALPCLILNYSMMSLKTMFYISLSFSSMLLAHLLKNTSFQCLMGVYCQK